MLLAKMKLLCLGMLLCTTNALFGKNSFARSVALKAPQHEPLLQISSDIDSSPTPNSDIPLASLIIQQMNQQEAFGRVQSIIDSHTRESTCNKAAYASLTRSCNTFESHDPSQSIDEILDWAKKSFAVRLAVCELSDSSVDRIPKTCRFILDDVNTRTQPNQRDMSRIQACITALDGNGSNNAWISYSNAKQDAIKICHATRAYAERDATLQDVQHILEVHRETNEASYNVTFAMMQAQSALSTAYERLTESIELQHRLNTDYITERARHLAEYEANSHATFAEMSDLVRSSFQDMITASQDAHHELFRNVSDQVDIILGRFSNLSGIVDSMEVGLFKASDRIQSYDLELAALANIVAPIHGQILEITIQLEHLNNTVIETHAEIGQAQQEQLAMLKESSAYVEVINISGIGELAKILATVGQSLWPFGNGASLRFFFFVLMVLFLLLLVLLCVGWYMLFLRTLLWPVYEVWQGFQHGRRSLQYSEG